MNNLKNDRNAEDRLYRSRLTRDIRWRYFAVLGGMLAVLIASVLFAKWLAGLVVWQPYDLWYIVLSWVEDNIVILAGGIYFIGWAFITYYFMAKPLRYLDEVVAASQQLVTDRQTPIVMSDEMKQVQDEFNQLREQSVRNEMLAREAEQRKNDMIVYLAHDLKTPLTSVIGYLTLLKDEPDISTDLRARYTGIALKKAERLEELINEFFDITRFNLTDLSLDMQQTDLSRMLEQITSEYMPVLAEKGLIWQSDIERDMTVMCDRDKLLRVFDNLIRNAVSYSYPDSPVKLSAKLREGRAEIRIENRGKTLSPEKLERIFERFFRADPSRASETGGAGLGLAIAKEIVELHSGSITAQSFEETVVFTLSIPAKSQKIV